MHVIVAVQMTGAALVPAAPVLLQVEAGSIWTQLAQAYAQTVPGTGA